MGPHEKSHDEKTRVVHSRRERYDVYIGRPSRWGNPFAIGKDGTRGEVLVKYRDWLFHSDRDELRAAAKRELAGKVLGCFCAPLACHGDVLAEVANAAPAKEADPCDLCGEEWRSSSCCYWASVETPYV